MSTQAIKPIKYVYGDSEYVFYIEVNAKKTEKDFCAHEHAAHPELPVENLKEVYALIREAAGLTKKAKTEITPEP